MNDLPTSGSGSRGTTATRRRASAKSPSRAATQIAESQKKLEIFVAGILRGGRDTPWSYAEVADHLGRPSTHGTFLGQCVSRIDAACFEADLPTFSLAWVVTGRGKSSAKTCDALMWRPVADELERNARQHLWTPDDFRRIRCALQCLPERSALSLWKEIEATGDVAVRRAVTHV